jgi:hypothetical protein
VASHQYIYSYLIIINDLLNYNYNFSPLQEGAASLTSLRGAREAYKAGARSTVARTRESDG